MAKPKHKRYPQGVTVVELLAVVAILGIMTTAYLNSGISQSRNQKLVETEARNFVSEVKAVQNGALTGSIGASGRFPCLYFISKTGNSSYKVSYSYRENAASECTPSIASQADVKEKTLGNGIGLTIMQNFGFTVPFGILSVDNGAGSFSTSRDFIGQVWLTKGNDVTYLVCVCGGGKVYYKSVPDIDTQCSPLECQSS